MDKFSDNYIIQRAVQILTKIDEHSRQNCIHCRKLLEQVYFNKNSCEELKSPQTAPGSANNPRRLVKNCPEIL